RRDVVDRLSEALVQEPLERGLLDIDQVGKVEDVLEAGKARARARRSDLGGQVMQPPLDAVRTRTAGVKNWTSGLRREPARVPEDPASVQGHPCGTRRRQAASVAKAVQERQPPPKRCCDNDQRRLRGGASVTVPRARSWGNDSGSQKIRGRRRSCAPPLSNPRAR